MLHRTFWSSYYQNCWRRCHWTFAEECGSRTIQFWFISAWKDKTNKTLFFLNGDPFSWPGCSPHLNLFSLGTHRMSLWETPTQRDIIFYPGSRQRITTNIRYFWTSVTVYHPLLNKVQWSQWSPRSTAAAADAMLMAKCLIMMVTLCFIFAVLRFWAGIGEYRNLLRAGGPGIQIPVRVRFSAPIQNGPGAQPASYTTGTRSLSWG
jgi:hypothetical protein